MIAANAVINSPPDGYTIMFVAPNNAIGTTLYKIFRSCSCATPLRSPA
jgi:hypothetical protein